MAQRIGPETRAIIEAIRELKQPAAETTNYRVITIDLTAARVNELYELEGWFYHLAVGKLTGDASIRLNEVTKESMDLAYVRTLTTPIRRFYITNVAQPGCELILGVGMLATFADPMRQGLSGIFRYLEFDEDGASTEFEASQILTDTPNRLLNGFVSPASLKSGIIKRIHYRLNPTNAVTYTIRIFRASIAANYESSLCLLYQSPPLQADDTTYDEECEIPFTLRTAGLLYYSIEWTGAPGVTPGFIELSGVVVE